MDKLRIPTAFAWSNERVLLRILFVKAHVAGSRQGYHSCLQARRLVRPLQLAMIDAGRMFMSRAVSRVVEAGAFCDLWIQID